MIREFGLKMRMAGRFRWWHHPSRRALHRWLARGLSGRVDRHIDHCAQCQEELDHLSALDESTLSKLAAATEPPEDLTERISEGLNLRLRDEEAVAAFADLFVVGWDFFRAVIDPDPVSDRSNRADDIAHDATREADEDPGGRR